MGGMGIKTEKGNEAVALRADRLLSTVFRLTVHRPLE